MERAANNFFIRNATSVAISTITLVMVTAGLLFYQQGIARDKTKALLLHTYEVTGHIQLLFNRLKDVELGQRGYIIAGEEQYLAEYHDALKDSLGDDAKSTKLEQHHSISEELTILRKLTSDNPVQQQNLDEMASYTKELLEYWAQAIEMRRRGVKTARTKLDFHGENQLIEQVHRLVGIMMAEENQLLKIRSDADETSTRQSNAIILWGLGTFYIIKVLLVWIYQKSRQRYTRELEQNEEELRMQQEELKASNEEIEASNEELEEKTKALEEQNAQIQQQSEELAESSRLIEEKAKEVARASKYKSEFLANMSHELRTPLNSLLILAKLLAANEEGNLTEEQIEEANVIHNGGLELLGLINDILDLSKVEAGKLTLTVEDIALDSIVKRVQQQFGPVSKDKGVAFHVNMSKGLPTILHTDSQRVEQILKNLLSNAFKFTETGSVTLEVRHPEQSETQRSSLANDYSIAFSVIDTGIGIETSKFKDIFEAFQQEDGSIDRHYGGTGLGLTIARKFAHMLGGEIHVTSKKGEGSRFTLVLPVAMVGGRSQEAEPESARIEMKPMPKTSVTEFIADDRKNITSKDKVMLIIEDDAAFASTLVKIARKQGYKCLAAGDGKTGLLLAAEEPVNAIILDLTLPDIDGMNVLDQLKHDLKTRHIPVHIISGREEMSNVTPMRKGAIGYLTKPVEMDALHKMFMKIEHLLQSEIKQVLVIEDDKKNQLAIQNLLRKKDVQITIADLGKNAMEQVINMRFDCIVLDLQLPDMTGFEWLESMGKTPLPPVIIYTARELTEEENRKLNSYTTSVIIKGAKSPERLLDEVTLFLHSVESTLSSDQQDVIRMQHNPDKVLQGRTILLTDDDLRNTFALSKLLKTHGMNIIIADNGQMALEKLRSEPSIELVIMDIMMPVMDGYQAMHEIRAQKAWSNIPIIALTARAMPEEQEKCMAAGANDYLTKPVDIDRLLTLLRVLLFKQEMAA